MARRWYTHPYNRPDLYRLAAALGSLPRALRIRVAYRVGQLAMLFMPAERAVTKNTLAIVTGAAGVRLEALTARLFGEYAICFSDLLHAEDALGSVDGAEHLEHLDGAVVSVTAHVGNWDMAGRLLARRTARATYVVVAPEEEPALEPWVRRAGDGVRFVTRASPAMAVGLLAALRRGETVAMQGDRALGNSGDVRVPFFGRPARFPIGPFRLAAAAGVAVVPAFCTLGADKRYELMICPPLVSRRGSEEDSLCAWVAALERLVATRPTQWFNFFDIWDG